MSKDNAKHTQTTNQKNYALPPPLLNTAQAAEFLGLKKGTLEKYRINGEGPQFIKFDRIVRYKVSALIDYISGKTFTCTADYELGSYH